MSKIRSMTGVGLANCSSGDFEFSVKAQSVNSRYLDVNIRIPSVYNIYEMDIRNHAREFVTRGKVDIYFDIRDRRDNAIEPVLNAGVVNAVITAINQLPELDMIDRTINAGTLLNYHQALKFEPRELDDPESFKSDLFNVLSEALGQLVENREEEGSRLLEDMKNRISTCGKLIEEIEGHVAQIKKEYKQKMKDRITELMESEELDEGRLEQEVAILLDKSDITEELVRFRSHQKRFEEIIESDGESGKKLDFLMQEFNREINTIGSKAKSADVNRIVVDIKSELEKVREQVQNIE